MSGGIAYVWDVQKNFSAQCNTEMIDLDPLDAADMDALREMLHKHALFTGSTIAHFILDDFDNQLSNFIKVFPKDYKRALVDKMALAEATK